MCHPPTHPSQIQASSTVASPRYDGSLNLPRPEKYGAEWWESTLRIIVYDAVAESAAFGLERALAVPDDDRGLEERRLMLGAALFLEAVIQRDDRRYIRRTHAWRLVCTYCAVQVGGHKEGAQYRRCEEH